MKLKYPKLLEPFQLKNVRLRNRIVKAAQWTLFAEPDGSVSERLIGFYESLARGGVGLITVEESICDYPLGASNMPHLRLDEDRFIPGLKRLAEAIHKYDCPAFVQITHAGPAHNPVVSDQQPLAPSSLDKPVEPTFTPSKELTRFQIKALVGKFAQAALRVKKAGFYGVEIHMAHYALGNAFLSRVQNQRLDEYGCETLENRARFGVEILQRVRQLVGPDFVVGVRMNGQEWGHKLGTTNTEAIAFAKMFEQAGADYLQVSAYGYGPFAMCAIPDLLLYPEPDVIAREFAKRIPKGALLPETAAIKKAVSIPVSGVGRLDPANGEQALKKDQVDLVCFGRRLLADPELPRKLVENREEDIRPCLGCSYCLHRIFTNQPLECRVNPFLGNETHMRVQHTPKMKKVMVVGAGPAGLEAARIAAERGHEVELYDKARELGGLLPMAAFIKGHEVDDLPRLLEYYERQLTKLGVTIHLHTKVTPALVKTVSPDVVVLATGGKPSQPSLPVKEGAQVVTTAELKRRAEKFLPILGPDTMNRLTKTFLPVGHNVVVIGGDLAGLETAEFLVKHGKEVTLLEEDGNLGEGMPVHWMARLTPWMAKKRLHSYVGVRYQEVTNKSVNFATKEGFPMRLEADTVMVVNKPRKNLELYQALKDSVPNLHLIGDAKEDCPGYVVGAIRDGASMGMVV